MRNKHYANLFMSPDPDGSGGGDPPGAPDGSDSPPLNDPPAGDPHKDDTPADPFYKSLPTDWRNQFVDSLGIEDDAVKGKKVAQLERFSDFGSMSKSFFDSQDKIRSGQIEKGLPENATDEQIKDYREANGVPETSEGYEASLDEGLVLGDVDQRIMGEVYKVAHDNNLSNETMSQLTNAMMLSRQSEQEAVTAQDGIDMQTSTRLTKELWGSDYEMNNNMIESLISKLPETVREGFQNARLANGQAVFNSPEMLSFFSDMARVADPAGTVVSAGGNQAETISDEIKSLKSRMGTDEWYKDSKSQERLRNLYDAQDRMKSK